MARKSREDVPGAWHHVINRGIAKRPLFERRADMRFFLSCLARQVRAGRLEVHAYCLMTTHFHLLLCSPKGELSEAMRRVQNEYSRRFNREHERDGSLIRGRYFSRPVGDLRYRRVLVRYIDANPIRAGIVAHVGEYEYCSAHDYRESRARPWLSRRWIETALASLSLSGRCTWEKYLQVFGSADADALAECHSLVDRRIQSNARLDPIEDLVSTCPPDVRAWMTRKARLSDGHRVGLPVCGQSTLHRCLSEHVEQRGEWFVADGRVHRRGSELAWVGLSHGICGTSLSRLAKLLGLSTSGVARRKDLHRQAIAQDDEHAVRCAEIVSRALDRILAS